MNILVLYHSAQTYTNTVFEHANAFARFSRHRFFFCHHDQTQQFNVDLERFDAVVIHYCLRLPYDQISESAAEILARYSGPKVLFIQDEYDHTKRTWHWIRRLGIRLVFTVVPELHISKVYPPAEFPGVRFVSNLTGYVPEDLQRAHVTSPPSQRELVVGYRGRPLPVRYGQLGFEKVNVGRMVKRYCENHQIPHDIAWSEEARIYGPKWYEFMASCRAMLGSESGSNVFDWDGSLDARISAYRADHPKASDEEVYAAVVAGQEISGIMNQVSPRVFECISARTAMVLFEGNYSGVVAPGRHFIPLRKDGSNLSEVFEQLRDGVALDAMTERAWQDVIGAGRYSYPTFVRMIDGELDGLALSPGAPVSVSAVLKGGDPNLITTAPIRWAPPSPAVIAAQGYERDLRAIADILWRVTPPRMRGALRPVVHKVMRPLWRGARSGLHHLLQRRQIK